MLVRDDAISNLAREHAYFFKTTGNNFISSLQRISIWVTSQNYTESAKSAFLSKADYFLIAHAHASGLILLTHEKPENTINKIKIPNVCRAFEIEYMNTFDMLRKENAKFVLP